MLKLMYITNKPEIAVIAENSGVDRIFIDLETIGKQERQGGMDTVQSHHTLEDVSTIRYTIKKAELLVRTNHIYDGSKDEIDEIVSRGADVIMLPYFKTVNEVAKFIDCVGGRTRTILLVETKEAVDKIDAILELEGIDEMYIGLNDLHLSYGMKFMFQLLEDGTIERLGNKFKTKGYPWGFGGIAALGKGDLPAERVIKEHYRLGSSIAILSRSFCNTDKEKNLEMIQETFKKGIADIRNLEKEAKMYVDYFTDNQRCIKEVISSIVNKK